MKAIKANKFDDCQMCGSCCKTPCDIIPEDIPKLLERLNMSLASFYKTFLVSLIVASPKYADEVLMMVPVRVDSNGKRNQKYLADNEYLNTVGQCIFLEEGKCKIHDIKPFGGRFMICGKMTGSQDIQLEKKHYFAFWRNNQHLFEEIFPGFEVIYNKLKKIYERKNILLETVGKNHEYEELHNEQMRIISEELYPLFNGCNPIQGIHVLT